MPQHSSTGNGTKPSLGSGASVSMDNAVGVVINAQGYVCLAALWHRHFCRRESLSLLRCGALCVHPSVTHCVQIVIDPPGPAFSLAHLLIVCQAVPQWQVLVALRDMVVASTT